MTRLLLVASNGRLVILHSCPARRQLPTTSWVHFIFCTLVGLVPVLHLCTPAHAQYSANFQTNLISGVSSNWMGNGTYVIGSNTSLDALIIQNGGALSNGSGFVGYEVAGVSNAVLVSGTGSVWSNGGDLFVGYDGSGNTLTITNGGAVYAGNGYVGYGPPCCPPGQGDNTVLVTGTGSVWSNAGDLTVGFDGYGNTLIIVNGGAVYDRNGILGSYYSSFVNAVTVSGIGSVWSNTSDLIVGDLGDGTLTITDGGAVYNDTGYIGYGGGFGGGGTVLVTGTGSVWSNRNDLVMGSDGGGSLIITNSGVVYDENSGVSQYYTVLVTGPGSVWDNRGQLVVSGVEFMISNGGAAYCASGFVGTRVLVTGAGSVWRIEGSLNESFFGVMTIADEGVVSANSGVDLSVSVSGGGLYVTNGLGTGTLTDGYLTLNNGTVNADSLIAGRSSQINFNGGSLITKATTISNGVAFVVGDGVNAATFNLASGGSGLHSFANGLSISSNALLTGCGTINGNVTVNPGGTVLASCGGTLAFTGAVTNNGDITAVNDTSINFYGPVVNTGVIDSTAGNVHFLGGLQNNGVVLPRSRITAISREGNDIRVTWTTVGRHSYVLQSTRAAAIASYNTNFADVSPILVATGTGLSVTNYLDAGVAYAPVLTAPGGQNLTTSGVPSMVFVSAADARGIADSLSQALPVGSLLMLGTFSVSEPTIRSNFFAGNLDAIMSAYTPYSTSFAVGDGTSLPASWSTSRSAAGFGGRQIYLLAVDKPNFAAATHLGVFTAPTWIFPSNGGTNVIALEDVTDFVVGARGGPLTINFPLGGETYTFDDTARLSYLPGRILFYRVRLVP